MTNAEHFQPTRLVRPTVLVRADNCPSDLGIKEPCPHCDLMHVRPGYCQALDPVSPGFRGSPADRVAARTELRRSRDRNYGPMPHAPRPKKAKPQLVTDVTDKAAPVTDNPALVTDNATLTCEQCGEAFQSRRTDARFCSAACRVKAHRANA